MPTRENAGRKSISRSYAIEKSIGDMYPPGYPLGHRVGIRLTLAIHASDRQHVVQRAATEIMPVILNEAARINNVSIKSPPRYGNHLVDSAEPIEDTDAIRDRLLSREPEAHQDAVTSAADTATDLHTSELNAPQKRWFKTVIRVGFEIPVGEDEKPYAFVTDEETLIQYPLFSLSDNMWVQETGWLRSALGKLSRTEFQILAFERISVMWDC